MKKLVYLVVALLIVSFALSVGGGSRISLGRVYPAYGIFYTWAPSFGSFEFGNSPTLQICGPDDRT